jgi:hypothetical protein
MKLTKKTKKTNKTNKTKKKSQSKKVTQIEHEYIYKKSKEIIIKNFKEFQALKKIFNNIELSENVYHLVDEKRNDMKLKETVMKYPSYLIWDETKKLIIDSLTKSKEQYIYKQYEYSFYNIKGTITFYSSIKYMDMIDNIIQRIIRIVGFYVEYTGNHTKLPDITIYYIDNNKMLPSDSKQERVLGKDVINSAFKNYNEIVIYRSEELFKLLTHELIHYYDIDSFVKEDTRTSVALLKIYNIGKQKNQDLKVYEAYTEAIATVLNIIFSIKPLNVDILYKELVFSLTQNAKIFNYFDITDSRDIYRKHRQSRQPELFKQNTAAFEYHYLKAKFVLNFNHLLELINRKRPYQKFINLKIPKIPTHDYIRLLGEDSEFDIVLNNIIKNQQHSYGADRNMRMTITE